MVQIGAQKPLKRCNLDEISALDISTLNWYFRIDRSLLKDVFSLFSYFLK